MQFKFLGSHSVDQIVYIGFYNLMNLYLWQVYKIKCYLIELYTCDSNLSLCKSFCFLECLYFLLTQWQRVLSCEFFTPATIFLWLFFIKAYGAKGWSIEFCGKKIWCISFPGSGFWTTILNIFLLEHCANSNE